MSLWSFARQAGSTDLTEAAYAQLVASALLATQDPGILSNVFGVGLAINPSVSKDAIHPVVLADLSAKGTTDGAMVNLVNITDIAALVESALGIRPPWLDRFRVFSAKPPELHVSPGDRISKPIQGTVGCPVSWTGGSGFVTAGHVGKPVGAQVYDQQNQLGKVVFTREPSGTLIEADVAVVDTHGCSAVVSNIKAGQVPSTAPNASISIYLASGQRSDHYRGFSAYIYFPSGAFGDLHMTLGQVTSPGDSGSPVVDANNVIIGHVVGSSPGVTTYVQDATFQIKEIAKHSQLSGISF